eukprot:GHVS01106389.1.p1 GENE.GHVS01106389.1~~GHVS01106389.1.p1  ORF type:complete len:379 (-),score=13.92 GHVS01106389.1:305-1441(-)
MTFGWLDNYRKIRLLSGGHRTSVLAHPTDVTQLVSPGRYREGQGEHDRWEPTGERSSCVWLVKDIRTDEYFALKVTALGTHTPKQLEHIKNEQESLERLSSESVPGVVKLKASYSTPSTIYLVLELSTGGPLHRHIRYSDGLPLQTTKLYVAQLVDVLGALHKRGYIYRDLKASNVTLDGSGSVTLVDLGFIKNIGNMSARTYSYCGTYHAMAPELHRTYAAMSSGGLSTTPSSLSSQGADPGYLPGTERDEGMLSVREGDSSAPRPLHRQQGRGSLGYGFPVDWWALGILSYEMIANIPPYGYNDFDDGRTETVRRLALSSPQHLDVSRLSILDDSGRDFIRQLLQSEASERLGTAGDMDEVKEHPWFQVSGGCGPC